MLTDQTGSPLWVLKLFKWFGDFKSNFVEQQEAQAYEAFVKARQRAFHDGIINDFLSYYYRLSENQSNLYSIGRHAYPIFIKPEWLQTRLIEDVLDRPLKDSRYEFNKDTKKWENQFEKTQRAWDKRVRYDADTFRLKSIVSRDTSWHLQCGIGSYFGYLSTCEELADELIATVVTKPDNTFRSYQILKSENKNFSFIFDEIKHQLQMRAIFAQDINQLLDFEKRDCKIGINVFLVTNGTGGARCWLYKRPDYVAEYPGLMHVLPAGGFQHDAGSFQQEGSHIFLPEKLEYNAMTPAFSLRYKTYSEFWEECFEGKTFNDQLRGQYDARIPLEELKSPKCPEFHPIRDLMILMENEKAFLFQTGFGIDLITASPQISMLLLIEDRYYSDRFKKCLAANFEIQQNRHALFDMTISDDNVKKIFDKVLPGHALPIAAMAVKEGFEAMKRLRAQKQISFDVPDIPSFAES
jgi:hypothetical protein